MTTDMDAVRQVIDVYTRSEKLSDIIPFIHTLDDIIPRDVLGFDLRSYAHYKAKDYKTAMRFGELALGGASAEEALAIRYNLGKCYLNANEPIKARNCFDIASKLQPDQVDVKLDLAAALYSCNQKDEARVMLEQLDEFGWRMEPKDEAAVQFNLGAHYLRDGDFKRGMDSLSIGRKLRIWGSYSHQYPIPEWDGTTEPGRHILVIGEGGIGDEIINARFVHHINARGMRASFASCHDLASVFARMPYEQTLNYQKFSTDIPNIEDYDCWTPAMNLPKTLGIDYTDLWTGPYLTPDTEYNEKWGELLDHGGVKVGIRWSGNPLYEQNLHRSVSLKKIHECLPSTWIKYSIQKDNPDCIKDFRDITDLEPYLDTFEDAIACINNLDVVITSCTSVAHAAAALGKRVFIMVPIMDYYVWAEGRANSSWYGDNCTLIRQTTPKNWDSAYAELREYLNNYLNNRESA